jgi:hypothetical protein
MTGPDIPRVVDLAVDEFIEPPPPLRTGAAGIVRVGGDGSLEQEVRLRISANSTHALIGHGVVAALNGLDLEGVLGEGAPVLIRPSLVSTARRVLYEADRKTYGGRWEFVVAREAGPAPVEYRVAVVNREYQKTLVRLVDVLNRASRFGEAAWIEL